MNASRSIRAHARRLGERGAQLDRRDEQLGVRARELGQGRKHVADAPLVAAAQAERDVEVVRPLSEQQVAHVPAREEERRAERRRLKEMQQEGEGERLA